VLEKIFESKQWLAKFTGKARLRARLSELGYVEGKNLRFDWRNQVDEAQARATAKDFVREGVDLIVAFEDQTVRAARAATTRIPIVFVHVYDPVADGYVRSLAHPGGNLTGIVSFLEVVGKRLQLFKEILPSLQSVLVLIDPQDPITLREIAMTREAAATLGVRLVEREMSHPQQAEKVFAKLQPGEVQGVFVVSPSLQPNSWARSSAWRGRQACPLRDTAASGSSSRTARYSLTHPNWRPPAPSLLAMWTASSRAPRRPTCPCNGWTISSW
jgi:ABC transporter substrate binding protein